MGLIVVWCGNYLGFSSDSAGVIVIGGFYGGVMESGTATADRSDVVTVEQRQTLADHLWAMSTSALAAFALYVADLGTDTANYEVDGCRDMTDWICARYSESRSRAREIVDVGTKLRDLPHIAEALRHARLSWTQVRHLIAFATADTDADWAGRAVSMSERQLAQRAAQANKSERDKRRPRKHLRFRHDRRHGGTHVDAYLSDDDAAVVHKSIIDRAEKYGPDPDGEFAPFDERLADALVDVCAGDLAEAQRRDSDRATITFHVDVDRAADGSWRFSGSRRTQPVWDAISDECLRRLACDAYCQTVYLRDGEPVFIDTKYRSPTAAQYRLLYERDGGCTFPGCPATRLLHAHHIVHWEHGGPTELHNLTLLCRRHHHYVHEGGGTVEGNPYTDSPSANPTLPPSPTHHHPYTPTSTTTCGTDPTCTGRPAGRRCSQAEAGADRREVGWVQHRSGQTHDALEHLGRRTLAHAAQHLDAVVHVHRGKHERQAPAHLVGRDRRQDRLVQLDHTGNADRGLECRHHLVLLDELVFEVGSGEGGQLQVEHVRGPPAIDRGGRRPARRDVGKPGEPSVEGEVVDFDRLGERWSDLSEGSADHGVFVSGVRLEQRPKVVHLTGDVAPGGDVAGVERCQRPTRSSQLGSDSLVDVLVEVEGRQRVTIESVPSGDGVEGEGHGRFLWSWRRAVRQPSGRS